MKTACNIGSLVNTAGAVLFATLACTLPSLNAAALPARLGDLDADSRVTVLDLTRLISHINGSSNLPVELRGFADVNGDGYINQADVDMLANAVLGIPIPTLPRPLTAEPAAGASEVGVTVRPRVYFPKSILPSTLNANNFYASFAGRKLPARIVPANDGTFAWLFFETNMPNASQIQVTVDGSTISVISGEILDADADLAPGGVFKFNFSTVSVVGIPNTVLSSRVVDPGPDLMPRTLDDVTPGAGGFNYLLPIQGVKVYVLGMENNVAYTDAGGGFTLTNMPVGDVKVVLDGRTATNPPAGYYFPEMVMDTTFAPGITNGVMTIRDANGNVVRDTNGIPIQALAMYLPRVASNVLQTISAAVTNMITLQSNAAYTLSETQRQYLTLEIMPNSLIGMNGQPMSSAQVGVSVVPPELVRDMLPPGLLQHTFDITVQAPGVATFSTPAPMTAPNVFNAPPGAKLNFLSFDHTTGKLMIEGTGTVSDDGLYVRTDPGTGITHPGWHGWTLPGAVLEILATIHDACTTPGCDCIGIALDYGGIAVAGATVVAEAPVVTTGLAIAGLVISIAQVANELFINHDDPTLSALGVVDASTIYGADWIEKKTTAGGLAHIVRKSGFDADGRTIYYRNLNTRIRAGAKNVGKVFNLFGVLINGADLHDKLEKCNGSLEANHAQLRTPPTALNTLISQIDTSASGIFSAVNPLISDALAPMLPTGRGVFPVVSGANLTLLELDGSAYIDPATGLQFSVPISSLLPPQWFSDAQFRQGVIDATATALQSIASVLSNSNPTINAAVAEMQADYSEARATLSGGALTHPPTQAPYYLATDLSTGQVVSQGRLSGASLSLFVAAENSIFVELVDPTTLHYGRALVAAGPSGRVSNIGQMMLVPDVSEDTDGDGLSNLAEQVIGTNPHKWSTAGDGISDGAKLAQGLDPLSGRGFPTGVIASLPLPGTATEVVIEGSILDSQQQTAYLALGSRGLGIVNASQFQKPILLGQLDLPGDSTDVAVDPARGLAVVTANAGGVHFVSVSDPLAPALVRTFNVNAAQVELLGGIAYVAVGPQLWALDVTTGKLLQTLNPGGANLTGLAAEGLFLYTMDAGNVLRVIDFSTGEMVLRGFTNMLAGGGKLFVGNGIAYVAAEGGFTGGFATANVSNPDAPAVLSGVDANNVAGRAVVANGSGLAVAVGSPGNLGNGLDVLNVSDPADTGAFITHVNLSADPFSVAIGAGIAFVADGTAGLQVVNYLPFDNQGQPPSIAFTASFALTSLTNGLAEEGKAARISAMTTDDKQVRDVEFYLDGVLVSRDVSFPFEHRFTTPLRTPEKANFTLRAKATDTGGNSTFTEEIIVALAADATPPRVTHVFPSSGGIAGSANLIVAYFNEPIAPQTLNSTAFQLVWAGTNGVLGDSNDALVTGGVITLRADLNAAQVAFTSNLPPGNYEARIGPPLADLAGNAMSGPFAWRFSIIGGMDGDQDGIPDDIELVLGLDPHNPFSRTNGVLDGDLDLDGDGLRTAWELVFGYDPRRIDSNSNGMNDGDEDPDLDGLTNLQEQARGTNPLLADTDGDGWPDGLEVEQNTDPLNPNSHPSYFITASPGLAILLPASGSGGTALGITVALPPVTIVLPASAASNGNVLGTTVAQPPINIVVFSTNSIGGAIQGVTIAQPPAAVQRFEPGTGAGPQPAVLIAQPPIKVKIGDP